ncbi:hypothetical protein [Salinigranum salinum]|uniref:hypothetical protein n=1 Tax=Salinigranum salinum TaxID=1364937 RepID=UPI0019569041|nr:hypothetical protein [Salinigranum salinum]
MKSSDGTENGETAPDGIEDEGTTETDGTADVDEVPGPDERPVADGPTHGSRHVSIEIREPPAPDESPRLDARTRVDTMVKDRLLPTARLEDGRYVAWWFDTDAPDPHDAATSEWVVAPTRFLAAATFRELTEDPARFDELVGAGEEEPA